MEREVTDFENEKLDATHLRVFRLPHFVPDERRANDSASLAFQGWHLCVASGIVSPMTRTSPEASRCEVTHLVMPGHTNGAAGVLFGGVMMQWIDICAGVSAMRHAGGPAVTASIDRLDFLVPVHVGEIVVLQSRVNYCKRSSMEVGVRVEVEDPATRSRLYTTKAYLTFVAMDAESRPCPVPELYLESEADRRRCQAAEERRVHRLRAAGRKDNERSS